MICTDVLGNSASFTGGNLGATDIVEQRCLTVVNVTHYRHNRRTRQQLDIFVWSFFIKECFRIIQLGGNRLVSKLFDHDHGRFLIQNLINRHHLT